MSLALRPITFQDACTFVRNHHRHHRPPRGWKFGAAAVKDEQVVGVVMVGRPVARMFDDGTTLEVTRLCTLQGARNAASLLYAAAWRAARALGYDRLVTYTLADETGISLRAAGWRALHQSRGGSWSRQGRPRQDGAPTCRKTCWVAPTGGQG